jgi:putative endonuclease
MVHSYLCRPLKRRVRLRARTPPFHGGDTGSNPVRGTTTSQAIEGFFYFNRMGSPHEFFMVFVYVIESVSDQTWYTGMAKSVINRLKEHNAGKNRFTKGHMPWKIIFIEEFPDWKTARLKEKYLKTAAGKNWLRKLLFIRSDTGSLPA